jgi:hypothetical protein
MVIIPFFNLIYALIERKPRMPHIRGIKGEAVVVYCELDNKGDGVLSAFPKGKLKRDKITESIFHRW